MQLTPLKYKVLGDGRKIELTEDFEYRIGYLTIKVPRGFISDGASTPKILWAFFPPWDSRYAIASIVHDYLYSPLNDTGLNKQLSDKVFDYIMLNYGMPKFKRKLMYKAVCMFGEIFFKPKLKNEGYKQKANIDKTPEAKEYYAYWRKMLGF